MGLPRTASRTFLVRTGATALGLAALGLSAAAPASGTTWTSAARAPAAANAVAGYISVYQNAAVTYYDYNSASGSVTMSPVTTGVYRVNFGGLSAIASRAIVQISTFGSSATCAIGRWGKSGRNLQATVDCFKITGRAHANAGFDVIVTRPSSAPGGIFDYAFANRPSSSGPLTGHQYSSAGKKNSVKRLGTGRYQVLLGGKATTGVSGAVKVSAYGDQAGLCDPVSWHGSAAGEVVSVDCFGPGHVAQDRKFMVSYVAGASLLGLDGQTVANVLADGTAAIYQPSQQYDSVPGAQVTVHHRYAGGYQLMFAGSEGDNSWGGDVEVNAVGAAGVHCEIAGWTEQATPVVNIFCYNSHGALTDSPFAVEWVVP